MTVTHKGSIPLGEVAARATHLEIACSRCERRGRYLLARLVATYGADFAMTNIGSELANCPRRYEHVHTQRCDLYYPGLGALMYGDGDST